MCHPRVSSGSGRKLDLSAFLPPQVVVSEPGHLRPVLRCAGELDRAAVPELGAALDSVCEREVEELLLDFGDVRFLDAGVLALIAATRARLEARGAALRILAGGQPLRLLQLTGILADSVSSGGTAEGVPRFEEWSGPSSSSSSPTLMSAPIGAGPIP